MHSDSSDRSTAGAVVDSLQHPVAIELRQLLEQQDRSRIIVDDEENILQALRTGTVKIERVFHTQNTALSAELAAALPPETPILELANRTSKKLFQTSKWARIFAVAQTPVTPDLAQLCALPGDIVVLEHVGISGNAGAIVRTAAAFGVAGMVLLDSDIDVYDRRLIRASRGHAFTVPLVTANRAEFVAAIDQSARKLVVTAGDATETIAGLPEIDARLAIVFGGEKEGCSPELVAAADLTLRIPIEPAVESLNVAAAAAIALHLRYRGSASQRP